VANTKPMFGNACECLDEHHDAPDPNNADRSVCHPCNKGCEECTSTECTTCVTGASASGKDCVCDEPTKTLHDDKCGCTSEQVETGAGKCVACDGVCDGCETTSDNCKGCKDPHAAVPGCLTCKTGFEQVGGSGLCVAANCKTHTTADTALCEVCEPGHYPTNHICKPCSDSGCAACPNNTCTNCKGLNAVVL
jgi:hypothetical protein